MIVYKYEVAASDTVWKMVNCETSSLLKDLQTWKFSNLICMVL